MTQEMAPRFAGQSVEVPHTVREMVELEQREKVRMTLSNHIADAVTAFAGSMPFVWLNVAWYAAWIGAHVFGWRTSTRSPSAF